MSDLSDPPAIFIPTPRHAVLQQLLQYWQGKRGTRAAPARGDIRPSEIKALLPDVMMWNVNTSGERFTMRLVGENIVRFVGGNYTGKPATINMPPDAAAAMIDILTQVVESKAPRFRIGRAFWLQEKALRPFEACYLPLSPDDETVDMILGGVKFDFTPSSALSLGRT